MLGTLEIALELGDPCLLGLERWSQGPAGEAVHTCNPSTWGVEHARFAQAGEQTQGSGGSSPSAPLPHLSLNPAPARKARHMLTTTPTGYLNRPGENRRGAGKSSGVVYALNLDSFLTVV